MQADEVATSDMQDADSVLSGAVGIAVNSRSTSTAAGSINVLSFLLWPWCGLILGSADLDRILAGVVGADDL